MFFGSALHEAALSRGRPHGSSGRPRGSPALDYLFSRLAKAAGAGRADSARSEMRTVKQLAFGRNIAQQGAPNRKH